jgi:hypothetical protein
MFDGLGYVIITFGGLAALWLAAKRAITVLQANIVDGELIVRRGVIAPRVLEGMRVVVKRSKIKRGSVRIERDAGRARLICSVSIPGADAQRLRNVVGSVPIAQLLNAGTVTVRPPKARSKAKSRM